LDPGLLNSDLLDPDPAENGPDPQPCYKGTYLRTVGSVPILCTLPRGTVPSSRVIPVLVLKPATVNALVHGL